MKKSNQSNKISSTKIIKENKDKIRLKFRKTKIKKPTNQILRKIWMEKFLINARKHKKLKNLAMALMHLLG